MKIIPTQDRIIVIPDILPEQIGSIVVPDSARKKANIAKVIAAGSGKYFDDGSFLPNRVGIGDIVLYNKNAGTQVKIGDEEYLVLKQDDVFAILENY